MKLKNISRLLSIGLLLNSFNLNSFASILSEDSRYETFNENDITINDILEEDNVNAKIEGETLVNHITSLNHIQGTIWKESDENFVYDSDNTSENFVKGGLVWNVSAIKPNTTYSFIYNCNNLTYKDKICLNPDIGVYIPATEANQNIYYNVTLGVNVIKFKTKDTLQPEENKFKISLSNERSGNISFNKNVMLLEGDWTNRSIPKYFEGLQSSFENQLITQDMVNNGQEKAENLGKYKVEVKSTGKNLFNPMIREENNTSVTNGGCTISYKDGIFTVTGNSGNDGTKETYNNLWYLRQQLKPNTRYTMSYSSDGVFGGAHGEDTVEVYLYNIDKKDNYIYDSISPTRIRPEGTSFTTGDTGIITCRFDLNKNDTRHLFYNIQIEEGSTATEYESYKESINTFYLKSPLLEGDIIEYVNGQATHIRRYKKITLKGDENWRIYSSGTTSDFITFSFYNEDIKFRPNLISDYFKVYKHEEWRNRLGYEKCILGGNTGDYGAIYVSIPRNELATEDLDGFRLWIQSNLVNVVCELAEFIYEPIKADLSVKLFEGITHISNNSAIPVNIEITVDRVLNRAVEAIELVKINPTVANISLARMWINLAKESIKKDELQNKIDIITDIEDLQIEKKSVTSNMDIYIKPLNSLSMSLSTNQIIFEDYSSVNDLDMNNALQISINSSLPYDLNSYLETDIQNSDGSSIINKDLLHIKDDTESEYKQFLGINQKLILKEDCEAGINNIHNIDLKLKASAHDVDIYKATIKFEAEQK